MGTRIHDAEVLAESHEMQDQYKQFHPVPTDIRCSGAADVAEEHDALLSPGDGQSFLKSSRRSVLFSTRDDQPLLSHASRGSQSESRSSLSERRVSSPRYPASLFATNEQARLQDRDLQLYLVPGTISKN